MNTDRNFFPIGSTFKWRNFIFRVEESENTNTKCLVRCTRGKYRSRTFQGLADAIALQWSEYILHS